MHPAVIFVIGALTGYAVSQSRKDDRKKGRSIAGQLALPGAVHASQVLALGPACSEWEILDRTKTDLIVRRAYIDARLAGITDPYRLTDRVAKIVAPKCHTPDQGIRNIGELDLYTSFFDSVLTLLMDDFPQSSFDDVQVEFQIWHAQQVEVLGG